MSGNISTKELAPHRYLILPFLLQLGIWPLTRCLLAMFTHMRVEGRENLFALKHMRTYHTSHKRGVLFVSNHESELDPIVIRAYLPFFQGLTPMFYVSAERREFARSNTLRTKYIYTTAFFNAWGAYAVTRGTGNYAEALKKHLAFLKRGWSVTIFPSGKLPRHDDTQPQVHGGAGYLAERADAIIVPVTITRTKTKPDKGFWSGTWRMKVTYHQPLFYDEAITQNFSPERHREGTTHIYRTHIERV